ncbi:protein xmas [Bicyclus anynana]|uniref:Protein xmas n=1 Tax=Bicyclus anynana TaxID=110368 RepID=A0ABM3LQ53_BICAN|nr:protein xmas [Bicyclus anynana]
MDEEPVSPVKKLRSPLLDKSFNNKTSVTCSNVPEGLFENKVAEKHFSKFGKVLRIRLMPKKHMCIVEYDQQTSAERAVLNAGAFDGFMFDVTRTKPRVRRKSKRDDDPEWLPDPDVKAELSAMVGAPAYRITRQKSMDLDVPKRQSLELKLPVKRKTVVVPKIVKPPKFQPTSGIESPVLVTTVPTTLSTSEAAVELHKLRARVSVTPDEKWRTLDARDRVLRAWGGAGSRVKVGGATIGTCPDMCPEKELLHRQSEHQVMTLETVIDSDGELEPWRAVKQYSRSSADQEIPMCYELRPAPVLMRTSAYLLHEIADTTRQVTLADWFHFMWDRFRGIRKDITQQALCCSESIRLVEFCARFHAHCAARLADLQHTQFDQKLNTDNLTKCLQTLKHMYSDVRPEHKPNEAEFRGYVALLNLGDANFWWEIKQLPQNIQKSQPIMLAIQIYTALDSNNYVKFFRLVKEKATYVQSCILLRYFNDVRARSLARIVKAYAPRGGSKYPAEELMRILAFESVESMKSFINHYGLRCSKMDTELTVILNRNHFIEDSDPYPLARSIKLIESKRQGNVGEVISGGPLPVDKYAGHNLYSSFNFDGRLKESALIAEDLGYNTLNDSNKQVQELKLELQKILQGRNFENVEREPIKNVKVELKQRKETIARNSNETDRTPVKKIFSFQPATPVAPAEVIKNSPEKVLQESSKSVFTFSKPQDTKATNLTGSLFGANVKPFIEPKINSDTKNIFTNASQSSNLFKNAFNNIEPANVFKNVSVDKSIFRQQNDSSQDTNTGDTNKNIFANTNANLFSQTESVSKNLFSKIGNNLFNKTDNAEKSTNIFAKPQEPPIQPSSIFGSHEKPHAFSDPQSIFKLENINKNVSNGETTVLSPSSLFKSANKPLFDANNTIFQTKTKAQSVADNIFKSVQSKHDVYEIERNENSNKVEQNYNEEEQKRQEDEFRKRQEFEERKRQEEERKRQEEERKRQEDIKRQELKRKEEEQRKQEALRLEELRKIEEKRQREEKERQEKLRKKLEEEKRMELKRQAEEQERQFRERIDKESVELTDELINEVNYETINVLLNEEIERLKLLFAFAKETTDNIFSELTNEICESEMKAEIFRTRKLSKKWFNIWRNQFIRNFKRRTLLEGTPVWLTDNTPQEEARILRRPTQDAALRHMNAIHSGYRFVGELKLIPSPKSYNIVDLIRSSLLKRMKQIQYPYDKCFFWKIAIVIPGRNKWLYRKINIEKWIQDALSDNKHHEVSDTLIHVGKQSWNNLIDFAVSVSLIKSENYSVANEALNGANGLLFYATETDNNLEEVIEQTLKHRYQYQVLPIAVIMAERHTPLELKYLNEKLLLLKNTNVIKEYKIFAVEVKNVGISINSCTRSALKWLAKNSPKPPKLEIDYLKSICQRYLGNEIWHKLKLEKDSRTDTIFKNLHKLVACYNTAVDKLTRVITNEDLFNYPTFPLEFNQYLNNNSPYPKPFEFIPSNVKQSDNTNAILHIMQKLKLPDPNYVFLPKSICSMQDQIRKYCNQIGCFSDPEEVVCKVVAILPNELTDTSIPSEHFSQYFQNYDLIDFLNVIIYAKINSLENFDHRLAIYEKDVLDDYRNSHWLFEIEIYSKAKHKILENEDELDYYIEAKRRKLNSDSFEYLMLEDKDFKNVEDSIIMAEKNISTIDTCMDAVSHIDEELNEQKKKSDELEQLLRAALSGV